MKLYVQSTCNAREHGQHLYLYGICSTVSASMSLWYLLTLSCLCCVICCDAVCILAREQCRLFEKRSNSKLKKKEVKRQGKRPDSIKKKDFRQSVLENCHRIIESQSHRQIKSQKRNMLIWNEISRLRFCSNKRKFVKIYNIKPNDKILIYTI